MIKGKLSLAEIGKIIINDRETLEIAIDLLGYARGKRQLQYHCDSCKKLQLDEYFIIEHRKETYVEKHWQLPHRIRAYCPTCYKELKFLRTEPSLCPYDPMIACDFFGADQECHSCQTKAKFMAEVIKK